MYVNTKLFVELIVVIIGIKLDSFTVRKLDLYDEETNNIQQFMFYNDIGKLFS